MEKSEDVFLIGEGAERFAREHGISFEDAEYLLTEARIAQLAEAKNKQAIVLDHSQANERKLGTVGAVARVRSSSECFAAVAVAGALWRASASGGALTHCRRRSSGRNRARSTRLRALRRNENRCSQC
jgi:beta-aspartyl-peptidase (threonine type)